MLTAYDISKLTDDELFKQFKLRGLNIGPISPTTRSQYEKKLLKLLNERNESNSRDNPIKIQANLASSMEDISNLTDDELYKELKSRGLNIGPVSPTTRNLYEKKLLKLVKEARIPGRIDIPVLEHKTKHKQTQHSRSSSTTSLNINDEDMESMPPPSAPIPVPSIFPKLPVETKENCVFPPLEFKLLNNEQPIIEPNYERRNNSSRGNNNYFLQKPTNILNDRFDPYKYNQHSFMRTTNLDYAARYPDMNQDHYNDSYIGYFQKNRKNEEPNLVNRKSNLLRFDPRIILNQERRNLENGYSTRYQTGIYNEPAPPQPIHIQRIHSNSKTWLDFVQDYGLYILAVVLIFLLFSIFLSSDGSNPID